MLSENNGQGEVKLTEADVPLVPSPPTDLKRLQEIKAQIEHEIKSRTFMSMTPQDRHIAYLLVMGLRPKQIAEELQISTTKVNELLKDVGFRGEVERLREHYFGEDMELLFKHILPKAVRTAEEIMDDVEQKAHIRLDAAFRFMDRSLGKPKQQLEVNGSLISSLFKRLDTLAAIAPAPIDAEFEELTTEAPKVAKGETYDAIDQLAEEMTRK